MYTNLNYYVYTYMRKIVVINFHPPLRSHLREFVCWTDKKIIADNLSYHFLIQVAVINVFPVCVLQLKIHNVITALHLKLKYDEN